MVRRIQYHSDHIGEVIQTGIAVEVAVECDVKLNSEETSFTFEIQDVFEPETGDDIVLFEIDQKFRQEVIVACEKELQSQMECGDLQQAWDLYYENAYWESKVDEGS